MLTFCKIVFRSHFVRSSGLELFEFYKENFKKEKVPFTTLAREAPYSEFTPFKRPAKMCDDSVGQNINEIFVNTGNLLESEELKRNITILPGEEVCFPKIATSHSTRKVCFIALQSLVNTRC